MASDGVSFASSSDPGGLFPACILCAVVRMRPVIRSASPGAAGRGTTARRRHRRPAPHAVETVTDPTVTSRVRADADTMLASLRAEVARDRDEVRTDLRVPRFDVLSPDPVEHACAVVALN